MISIRAPIAWLVSLGMVQGASFAGVAPTEPVITIQDPCTAHSGREALCTTEITREEFERLTDALEPGMSPSQRLAVANALVRIRRMSAVAELRGLDRTPAFHEEMQFARMQLLSQDLTRVLQAEALDVTETDVDAYYTRHPEFYELATLARIFVPRGEPAESMREANDLRERAVRGEDPDQLQRIAFARAGLAESTVNTQLESVRKAALPVAHESAFDLHPGEVSTVFSDPGGGYFIYKMLSRRSMARDEARPEIRKLLAEQRYRDASQGFVAGYTLNDTYFNPPEAHATRPAKRLHERGLEGSAER